MGARKEFDLKLKHGEIVEGTVAAMLTSLKVEIKADTRFSTTGNVCVEYAQDGADGQKVPSGINVTEAEWWCFRFEDDTTLLVPTKKLKRIAREYRGDAKHCKLTGDNGNLSVLIPVIRLLPCPRLQMVKS